MSTTMSTTPNRYQLIASDLEDAGYTAARRMYARRGASPKDVSALCLLAAGFTWPEVRTLFQIAARLTRHETNVCNRPVTAKEVASAERDESLATQILNFKVMDDGSSVRRSTVQEAQLTGLPGGAAIKVRLLTTSGDVIAGNDAGDTRFICI